MLGYYEYFSHQNDRYSIGHSMSEMRFKEPDSLNGCCFDVGNGQYKGKIAIRIL